MRSFACVALALVVLALPALAGDARVDHSGLDALLKRHVDGKGLVDYKAWKEKDLPALDAYLKGLETVDEARLDRNEKLALHVNAYNAITLRAMLEFYPLKSIKEKVSTLGYNVWKDYKRRVAGRELSLDAIEHEVLRKMGEPRIHFAIVCASKGCPVLRAEAFDAARIDAQLEDQVKRAFADPTKLKVEGRIVRATPLFDWFGGDFGASETQRLTWIAKHVTDEATRKAILDTGARLEFLDWDWSLNEKS